jgi:uncharacterized damage-inducible protein DinB
MNKTYFQTLYQYNAWATRRILDAAAPLTPEQLATFSMPGISAGSLRGALVHAYRAEAIWRRRIQPGAPQDPLPAETDFLTLEALVAVWQPEMLAMQAYIASLADADLLQTIHYKNTKGQPFSNPLWHILAHVVNHSTQCRSEAAMALTALGRSPGDLDLILFLRG